MAGAVFDAHELDEFNQKMVKFYSREFPKETKKFMNQEGNEGRRILRRYTKATTKKKTGNLMKGIDKGPAHKRGNDWQVRVRNKAPHAHLIEHGHGQHPGQYVPAIGKRLTADEVQGKHPAGRAQRAIAKWFTRDVEKWVDEMLKEGLR